MKKVAIIAFFHSEMSLCLAKYIAKQGTKVDYYYITDFLHDKGYVSGFEYKKAQKRIGIINLSNIEIPEICNDTKGLNIKYHLIRILSYSKRLLWINKLIFYKVLSQIRRMQYDVINVIGQHPWVEIIHDELKGENLVHTFHEIGSHEIGNFVTPLMNKVIMDKSKIILPSQVTFDRFNTIQGATNLRTAMIPVGKHETLLLYEKDINLDLKIDKTKVTFLFYGYIRPYKGLKLLREVMESLPDYYDEFNLVIAGGGYDENLPYFQSLDNCQVINRFLTNEEMMKLNRISTAIVLPYKTASQSGIILTSFMLGKTVIATKVGALAETVKDGYNGILVAPDDAKAFAMSMIRLIKDKELLYSLQQGALNFGQGDEYDWNNIANRSLYFFFNDEI
mgnify:CR=1 FL=1